MADISKITLPSGTTYDIKDAVARQGIAGGVHYIGLSSTAITDGGTEKPTIGGTAVTPKNGDLAIYNGAEFIYTGTYGSGGTWAEFGDMSTLGDLAYKDSASGTVAVPKTYTTTVTPSTTSKYVASSATGGGSASKSTVDIRPINGGTATYTPAGSNAASSVTGSCSVTPSGSISTGTGTANYTPAGSVAAPTISVATAGSTTTIKNPTSKTVVTDMSVSAAASGTATGELVYCSVSNETLTLSKFIETTGDSITTSNVTVKNGDASYSASAPAFTGTGTQLKFTGSSSTGTISGTAAAQTFTGTGAHLITESEVYTSVTMPSFSSQTIATGISSASTTTATTENKTVTVT